MSVSSAGGSMPDSRRRKLAYSLLVLLFLGAIAFQLVLSVQALQHVWSEARHFQPGMLTSLDLEFFAHVLAPLACLLLGFYVARARTLDILAWLLLAVLISFSLEADGANTNDEIMLWSTPLKHLALAYRSFGLFTFPVWLILFSI